MKNPMDRQLEKRLSDRSVAIGREGEVAAFGETTSSKLIEAVDDFMDLSADKAKFLIQDYRRAVARPATNKR